MSTAILHEGAAAPPRSQTDTAPSPRSQTGTAPGSACIRKKIKAHAMQGVQSTAEQGIISTICEGNW
jgi:hypothetical protein